MDKAAASPAKRRIDVHVFRDSAFAHAGDSVVCVVEKKSAEDCLGARWQDFFGGGAIYEAPTKRIFIGVWGARNAARIRRFLREQSAEVVIHYDRPMGLRLRQWNTMPGSRPRVRDLKQSASDARLA